MIQRYAFFGLPNFVQRVSLDSKAGIPKEYGCDFVSVMPANLYGTGDNYDLQSSHVLPALIRKFHEAKMSGAKEVVLWGTGSPLHEFRHADDMADATVFCMLNYSDYGHVNVGSDEEITIKGLAEKVRRVVGFEGEVAMKPQPSTKYQRALWIYPDCPMRNSTYTTP